MGRAASREDFEDLGRSWQRRAFSSDPLNRLTHPSVHRQRLKQRCRCCSNPHRCSGLEAIVNRCVAVRGLKQGNSINYTRMCCWEMQNPTCDAMVSVGPPSNAWLNKDSFISKLLSRSRESFDLSRSRRKACCCIDTWSRTTNWSSVSPCCLL